jgi:thiol-disulfide isomerase/thioredoxin
MNQIKNLTIILFFGLIISSCSQNHNVSAVIEGYGNDTVFIEYVPLSQFYEIDETYKDTVISIDDHFEFDIPSDEPIFIVMDSKKSGFTRLDGSSYRPNQKSIIIFLNPDEKISVKGKLHDYYLEYEAYGSEVNEAYSQVRSKYVKETSEAVKIELKMDSLYSKEVDQKVINALFDKRTKIQGITREMQLEYMKQNWDKELSTFFLTQQRLDTLAVYYDKLPEEYREGRFKEMLDYKMMKYKKYTKVREAEENIVEGKVAPNFVLQSIDGNDFELYSISKDYVVLDFWGSWCGWCIKGFPKMKEYYNKYNSHLEIIGIACNDTEDKWRNSVEENELDWIHVINDSDFDKDVSVTYGIKGYPTKVILDKDKKIVAKYIGESEDFYNKIDELIKND